MFIKNNIVYLQSKTNKMIKQGNEQEYIKDLKRALIRDEVALDTLYQKEVDLLKNIKRIREYLKRNK